MRRAERRKVNIAEIKFLRSLVGVSLMDRVGNEEVRRRAGIKYTILIHSFHMPEPSQYSLICSTR